MLKLTTLLCSAALLAACGGGDTGNQDTTSGSAGKPTAADRNLASGINPDMVTAVSAGKPGAPVELKFELKQRPQPGSPFEVAIALIPVSELDRLQVTFQAGQGLAIQSGQAPDAFVKPEQGQALSHTVTALAERDGIYYLSAVALADSRNASLARSFSIPIIVGQGMAAPKPKAQGITSTDATGTRIESMPAEEPGATATQ